MALEQMVYNDHKVSTGVFNADQLTPPNGQPLSRRFNSTLRNECLNEFLGALTLTTQDFLQGHRDVQWRS